jgi:hypothetical protein
MKYPIYNQFLIENLKSKKPLTKKHTEKILEIFQTLGSFALTALLTHGNEIIFWIVSLEAGYVTVIRIMMNL